LIPAAAIAAIAAQNKNTIAAFISVLLIEKEHFQELLYSHADDNTHDNANSD